MHIHSMADAIQMNQVSRSIKQAALAAKPCWMVGAYVDAFPYPKLQNILMFHLTQKEAEQKCQELNEALGIPCDRDGVLSIPQDGKHFCMYDVWEQWEGQHLR